MEVLEVVCAPIDNLGQVGESPIQGGANGPMVDPPTQSRVSSVSQLYDLGTDSNWYACAQIAVKVCDQVQLAVQSGDTCPYLDPDEIDSDGKLVSRHGSDETMEPLDSIAHLPPETIGNSLQPPDARAHVYGIGLLLYHRLCGRLPFHSADNVELTRQIRHDLPQPPRQLAHRIPLELEDICLQALAKAPVDRQESPRVIAEQLRKIMAEAEDSATESSVSVSTIAGNRSAADRFTVATIIVTIDNDPDGRAMQQYLSDVAAAYSACPDVSASPHGNNSVLVEFQKGNDEFESHLKTLVTGLLNLRVQSSAPVQDGKVCLQMRLTTYHSHHRDAAPIDFSPVTLEFHLTDTATTITRETQQQLSRWLVGSAGTSNILDAITADFSLTTRPTDRPPFSGRQSQLGLLESRWNQCLEGLGQVVLISGEAGSGKTRLIDEFADSLLKAGIPCHRLTAICRPGMRGVAYGCFREQISESWFGVADAHQAADMNSNQPNVAMEETVTLTDVPPDHNNATLRDDVTLKSLSAMSSQDAGPDPILKWLSDAAAESPILFTIEDIQWADPTTLDLLFDFVRRAPHNRVLFVMTCRDTFETPWASHHNQCQISLRPLTRKHIQILLENVASDPITSEYVKQVKAFTGGNPSLVLGVSDRTIRMPQLSGHSP